MISGILAHPAEKPLSPYPSFACGFAVLLVFCWVAWTTAWDAGLYGDNVEQFVWVRSLQWGYHKHPPMPTWLLSAAIYLMGSHSWLTNALAAVCMATTGWLTWLITRRLFNPHIANIAIVLWGLEQCFSLSAQIYNHNTVLVMFMAATVYAALRALDAPRNYGWSFGVGVFAGCAMLSKYQAALPLGVLLIAIGLMNRANLRAMLGKLLFASVGFAVVFSPHFYWSVQHQFPALRYASAAIEAGGLTRRLAWVATFIVNQIRMVLPLLLTIGLSLAICKILNRSGPTEPKLRVASGSNSPDQSAAWMWALVWAPLIVVVTTSLVTGSQLRNHWGVQLFQFFPIWVAWRWHASGAMRLAQLVPIALMVHALGFAYYAIKQSDPNAAQATRRADSAYPAREMADAALAHWKQHTRCPLKLIGGDFEAGLVSAFTTEFPVVYTDAQATPWVSAEQVKRDGLLYVSDMASALPESAIAVKNWYLNPSQPNSGRYVQFAVELPANECKLPE